MWTKQGYYWFWPIPNFPFFSESQIPPGPVSQGVVRQVPRAPTPRVPRGRRRVASARAQCPWDQWDPSRWTPWQPWPTWPTWPWRVATQRNSWGKMGENLWKTYGKPMENIWKTYGKHMQNYGKHMENYGKTYETYGKMMDNWWTNWDGINELHGKMIQHWWTFFGGGQLVMVWYVFLDLYKLMWIVWEFVDLCCPCISLPTFEGEDFSGCFLHGSKWWLRLTLDSTFMIDLCRFDFWWF